MNFSYSYGENIMITCVSSFTVGNKRKPVFINYSSRQKPVWFAPKIAIWIKNSLMK